MTVPERADRSFRTFRRQGWEILVGKGARDNDVLTFEVAERGDLWLHVAEWSGSHVVIRVPESKGEPPREVVEFAARLRVAVVAGNHEPAGVRAVAQLDPHARTGSVPAHVRGLHGAGDLLER